MNAVFQSAEKWPVAGEFDVIVTGAERGGGDGLREFGAVGLC